MDNELEWEELLPDGWNHARAHLEIVSSTFTAEEISRRLSLMPKHSTSIGEPSLSWPEIIFDRTTWCYLTPLNSHNTVPECLELLAQTLDGKLSAFLELQSSGAEMTVLVMQSIWTEDISYELSPETLQFFATYRLPIRFYLKHHSTPPTAAWLRRTGKKSY